MKKTTFLAATAMAALCSCTMNDNPFLTESQLPYGAPQFDKIQTSDYKPAFLAAINEAKAEIDAIVDDASEPDFANTVEALEFCGEKLNGVASVFYNLMEADTNEDMQNLAEELAPLMTEYDMYVSLNDKLFKRVKAVYEKMDELGLEQDQKRLLEKTYKGFVRNGANLSDEDKEEYGKLSEQLSLLQLQFSKNSLAATNAYALNITDEADLAGLPQFVRDMGAATAAERGESGWTFDLSSPSMGPFLKYSTRRDLRKELYMHSNTKAVGGEFDNLEICRQIVDTRIKIANLLGYRTYADYVTEDRMVKGSDNVMKFLSELAEPSIVVARQEVADILAYAKANGFEDDELQSWDFSYWSEKYKAANYDLEDSVLKPYFKLESCIDAVFGLATRLYGISFDERTDIPGYNKDVKVYDVKDKDGSHLALFYVDFFPRTSKRSGAWMTDFRGQSVKDGVERRPFVSLVTNFSKPTADAPSLLTHDELTTFLHEFGHSLHGMLAQGRYGSLTGTNVDHDFVELPSQIMENWAFEPEFLKSFARHYETGEVIPDALIEKIVASKNYLAAYSQVRQLQYGYLDMAWYDIEELPEEGTVQYEKKAFAPLQMLPELSETCMSVTFSHIFSGGYAAGYYSYKWAEVLAADAFSLFAEKGIFNTEISESFRNNILSKGSSEDESVLYRNFRGHDPQPKALLESLGITPAGK